MNRPTDRIYDVLGVGVGPFNLGLCALLQPLEGIDSLFFEAKPEFYWHAGMLIGDATLQVSFMADLVTMADPRSRFTFLNYLHEQGRLYQFCSYENFFVPRAEYNRYCQWVSKQLDNIRFSSRVVSLERVDDLFRLTVIDPVTQALATYLGRDLVIGVGTEPAWPSIANPFMQQEHCIHSSRYLHCKRSLQAQKTITLVGSGQSAAEIFLDLLKDQPQCGYEINWLSRSRGFISMESSKLGAEHFSPDYVEHFHALPEPGRLAAIEAQSLWYKGISMETIRAIYDCLYFQSIEKPPPVVLQSRTVLEDIAYSGNAYSLVFRHLDMHKTFGFETDAVILATGYTYVFPDFLSALKPYLEFDSQGHALVNRDYTLKTSPHIQGRIYVQNAELHTHGVSAPDLAMGAYRSASIINHLTGRDHYHVQSKNMFQTFGIAPQWA